MPVECPIPPSDDGFHVVERSRVQRSARDFQSGDPLVQMRMNENRSPTTRCLGVIFEAFNDRREFAEGAQANGLQHIAGFDARKVKITCIFHAAQMKFGKFRQPHHGLPDRSRNIRARALVNRAFAEILEPERAEAIS